MPPSIEELHKRLHARETETPETLKIRVAKSEHELTFAFRFDKILVNDDKEKAFKEAQELVDAFLK
jgi:guanylate kinase